MTLSKPRAALARTLVCALTAVSASAVAGNPPLDGLPDPGFGTAGRAIIDVTSQAAQGEYAVAIAQAPSGTLYVGGGGFNSGRFVIARLNPDGSRVTNFGTNGLARDRPSGDASLTFLLGDLKTAADGKPLATGWAIGPDDSDVVLCRYNVAGNLDTSFGGDGCVRPELDLIANGSETAQALAVLADGKFLIAGSIETPNFNNPGNSALLLRLNADGSVDQGFGVNGLRTLTVDNGTTSARSIALGSDGSIYLGGTFKPASSPNDFERFVAKYTANGALVGGFGANGVAEISFDDFDVNEETLDYAGSLLVDAQDRIYDCGASRSFNPGTLLVFSAARLTPQGQPDGSFGSGGRIYRTFNDLYNVSYVNGCALQGSKLVAALHTGNTGPGSDFRLALMRLAEDGSGDPSFGAGGSIEYPIDLGGNGIGHEFGVGVINQGEHLLVLGSASPNPSVADGPYSYAVVRALRDEVFRGGLGGGGGGPRLRVQALTRSHNSARVSRAITCSSSVAITCTAMRLS
ncbi:MAG: hypothetical protein IPK27_03900 [Rhodanobacteraceae bacterium]|nr:hypothetical protein [Rhodanobacteraceae bacterium]